MTAEIVDLLALLNGRQGEEDIEDIGISRKKTCQQVYPLIN